jgi:hypothetical protein
MLAIWERHPKSFNPPSVLRVSPEFGKINADDKRTNGR